MSANKTRKFIWIPRFFGIAFALFLILFSFDVFENGVNAEAFGGFLMHSVPSFLLLIFIALSWKTPAATGLLFVLAGLFFLVRFRTYDEWTSFFVLSVLPAVIGLLFFVASILKSTASPPVAAAVPETLEEPEDADDIEPDLLVFEPKDEDFEESDDSEAIEN